MRCALARVQMDIAVEGLGPALHGVTVPRCGTVWDLKHAVAFAQGLSSEAEVNVRVRADGPLLQDTELLDEVGLTRCAKVLVNLAALPDAPGSLIAARSKSNTR